MDPGTRAVCIREIQRSLDQSVKSLIEDKIRKLDVGRHFDILDREIYILDGRGRRTGVIIFEGMQNHTADSIKSLEGYRIAWVEEAQTLSARSMELLTPTLRLAGSQIWFSWNPDDEEDPVDAFMRSPEAEEDPDICAIRVNYSDNPWFKDTALVTDMVRMRRTDPDKYAHIWLGEYRKLSDAQVLRGRWSINELEPQPWWDGPYFGADWGFSVDPTALVKLWVNGKDRTLYLEAEAYGHQVDIDLTPNLFDKIPGSRKHVIRADNARPETISFLRNHGFPKCVAAEKWPGSVEDGVEHLRSYDRIVIHPNCTNAIREARAWSWKIDKRTGDVLPDLVDKDNHIWDAARYALAPIIRNKKPLNISDAVLRRSAMAGRI